MTTFKMITFLNYDDYYSGKCYTLPGDPKEGVVDTLLIPKHIKKDPKTLYIEFHYSEHFSETLILDAIKTIKKEFAHCNILQFIATDGPPITNDDWYTIPSHVKPAYRPEFQFYSRLKKAFPFYTVNFFYPQFVSLKDYDIKWACPSLRRYCREDYGVKPNINSIKYKLSCLINRPQLARTIFAALSLNLNCFQTFNKVFQNHMHDVDVSKFTSQKLKGLYKENIVKAAKTYCVDKHFVDGSLKKTQKSHNLIQKGFCNVVIEDPVFCDWHRITEKTMKPMVSFRPFILLSTPGTLSYLRSQGFKTFSAWWDESYDDITDHYKRIEKVYEIAEFINSLSRQDVLNMYNSMQEVLLHNQKMVKIFAEKSVSSLFPD